MRLVSCFQENGLIPSKYTCDGKNILPPLRVEDLPPGTKSLAFIMDDPDAVKPAGHVWDHWLVWNVPPPGTIEEGKEPAGVHGKNHFNKLTWGGPCPPDGEHTYVFAAYALDTALTIPEGSTKQQLLTAMKGHVLAKAVLRGRYKR